MKYLNFCRGCKKKNLFILSFDNLQICKDCLLVSKQNSKNHSLAVRDNFKYNKGYNFSVYENTSKWDLKGIEKRSHLNYFFFKKILNHTKLKKKDRILDFGCGYGALLYILKKKGYNVFGIEPSIKNFKIAKKINRNVKNGYLNYNTFRSGSFKVVISLYVFTYIDDLHKIFKILRKILKKDGFILIRVHQYKFSKTYSQLKHFKKQGDYVCNHFSNTSLKNLFNFHNFDIVSLETNMDGTTIIAKKTEKKNSKMIGSFQFEIFYIKYLVFIISNIILAIHKFKLKIRKIILGW